MRRSLPLLLACGVVASSAAAPARRSGLAPAPAVLAQERSGQPAGRGGPPVQNIQQVKPGLYVVAGGGANSIVRVTSEGIILVDTKLPGDQIYSDLMAQIRTVGSQPVKVAIVTHHHADHTGNTARFLDAGAQVVGHEALKRNLETYQFSPRPAPPSVTYEREFVVRLGGAEARVLHLGRAHTSGDSVVYFPDLKVLATSDVVTTGGQGPLVDYAGGGSALEWRQVLGAMLALDFDTAIPGNGPALGRAEIQDFRAKFDTVVGRALDLVRTQVPKDRLLAELKTDDIGWAPRIPQIDQFYEELSAAR